MNVATEKMGICQRPMPLARKRRHVTMKLIAAMMDEAPSTARDTVQKVTPSCGEYAVEVSGAYLNQPVSSAPPKRKLLYRSSPPKRNIQELSPFIRRNALSRAPTRSGTR